MSSRGSSSVFVMLCCASALHHNFFAAALHSNPRPFRRSSRLGGPPESGLGGGDASPSSTGASSSSSFSNAFPVSSSKRTDVRLKSAATISALTNNNVHHAVYPNSFANQITSFDVYEALTTSRGKLVKLPASKRLAIGLAEFWQWAKWRVEENIRAPNQSVDIRQEVHSSFDRLKNIAGGKSELHLGAAASVTTEHLGFEYETTHDDATALDWGNIYREMSSEEEEEYADDLEDIEEYLWSNAMSADLDDDFDDIGIDDDAGLLSALFMKGDSPHRAAGGEMASSSSFAAALPPLNENHDEEAEKEVAPAYELIDTAIAGRWRSRERSGESAGEIYFETFWD